MDTKTKRLLKDAQRELKLYIVGSCLLNGYKDAAINSKLRDNRVLRRLDTALSKA